MSVFSLRRTSERLELHKEHDVSLFYAMFPVGTLAKRTGCLLSTLLIVNTASFQDAPG